MNKISFLLLVAILGNTQLFAQQTSLSMQLKPRMELRDGYTTLPAEGSTPGFHTNERIRFDLRYTSKKLEVVAQPQYIYTWGQNAFNAASDNNFSVYQAYAQMNLCGKGIDSSSHIDKVALRIGRQELNYDGGRILSNLDWAPQGIRHDAALLILENKSWSMQAGAGFNQEAPSLSGTLYTKNMYKAFQMIRLHKEGPKFRGSVLFFKDDFQNYTTDSLGISTGEGVNSRINAGTYLSYSIMENITLEGEFYAQQGKDVVGNTLNAYLINVQLVLKALDGKLSVTPGMDIVSGNDGMVANGENNAFLPTYGINHKFYGFMDYFYTTSPFGTAGLQDIFIRTNYKVNAAWSTWVHFHYFSSANNISDVADPTQVVDPYFGTEIDWVLNYTFDERAQLQFGAATMIGSETLKQVKGLPQTASSTGMFTYLQFLFTPKFL